MFSAICDDGNDDGTSGRSCIVCKGELSTALRLPRAFADGTKGVRGSYPSSSIAIFRTGPFFNKDTGDRDMAEVGCTGATFFTGVKIEEGRRAAVVFFFRNFAAKSIFGGH